MRAIFTLRAQGVEPPSLASGDGIDKSGLIAYKIAILSIKPRSNRRGNPPVRVSRGRSPCSVPQASLRRGHICTENWFISHCYRIIFGDALDIFRDERRVFSLSSGSSRGPACFERLGKAHPIGGESARRHREKYDADRLCRDLSPIDRAAGGILGGSRRGNRLEAAMGQRTGCQPAALLSLVRGRAAQHLLERARPARRGRAWRPRGAGLG